MSPFGGYTCNTEFEFLTGLSMGVLPRGSVPYLQYVSKQYPFSLPSHLDELGYKSVAVHPYLEDVGTDKRFMSLWALMNS